MAGMTNLQKDFNKLADMYYELDKQREEINQIKKSFGYGNKKYSITDSEVILLKHNA